MLPSAGSMLSMLSFAVDVRAFSSYLPFFTSLLTVREAKHFSFPARGRVGDRVVAFCSVVVSRPSS